MAAKAKKVSRRTKTLQETDRLHLWHPFTQMSGWAGSGNEEELIIERGSGNCLIDTEGKRYLDGVSSLWVTVHGHRKKEIDRAVIEQLGRIAHSTLLGLGNVPSIELARMLVDITPNALKRVFYSDSGSTAVEVALKIAFQYCAQNDGYGGRKRKREFIAFSGAYHGDTLGSMSVGGIDVFTGKYGPLFFKAHQAPYPYCYRCPVKKEYPSCALACVDRLEAILEKNHERIAACIIEPLVQGAAGIITSPPGFLRSVRRLTRKYDVLLIADEVATGFGRTGRMFACEHERVTPDILCLAKGITGGYLPLAATLTTEKIYRAFLGPYAELKTLFHGHTYTGNPLGCAAAIASLKLFKKEHIIERVARKARLFKRILREFHGLEHVGDVRQRGLMAGIELVQDRASKRPYPMEQRTGHRVCMEARKRGLIIRPLGDTVVLMPPLGIKQAELKRIAKTVFESIKFVTRR